jgi:AcrR family transcriptional regulator
VPVDARPSLRERQRQETHLLIRRTALALAAEHGVAGLSVQAICAEAGISARTFFNHFRSKDEALLPDFPEFSAAVVQAFVDAREPDLVAALETLLGNHLALAQEQQAQLGISPADMMRLLEANPELLPRALVVFGGLEQRVAGLVARRTGRPTDELFCTVAALTATSALRAGIGALPDAGPVDADLVRRRVADAFAVLRRLVDVPPAPPVPRSGS